ncbi:putative alpha-2-macroglobulin domain-containing protein [Granulibacter bethesdensis]|nr:putative alpha-2-macroglobulin domain-containing protein [Granulibacter bethesdensis]
MSRLEFCIMILLAAFRSTAQEDEKMSVRAATHFWTAALLAGLTASPAFGQDTLQFRGVAPEQTADSSGLCLRFDDKLSTGAGTNEAGFLKVSPAARIVTRVTANRLCVDGLSPGRDYTITVLPGLTGSKGQKTSRAFTVKAAMPDRDPMIAVGGKGWILSRATASGLTIQTVNTRRVRVRVFRMGERLLSSKLTNTGQYGRDIDLGKQNFSVWELRRLLQSDATQIWSGTMDTGTGAASEKNATVETAFPIPSIIKPEEAGAYLVIAENADRPAVSLLPGTEDGASDNGDVYESSIAGHWLIATRTGLSTWQGEDGLTVVARALSDAMPQAGLSVHLLSRGQDVLATAKTDSSGKAHFAAPLLAGTGAAAPALLIAQGGKGDIAVQSLESQPYDLSDRGVSGRQPPGPIEAYLYADRGIYRPGETIHVMALLRQRSLDAAASMPLSLVLRRPNGMEAKRITLDAKSSPSGGFQHDFTLPDPSSHGHWTIEALTDPSRPPVGTLQVQVRDFVPQTLAVTLDGMPKAIGPVQPITGTLTGRFLYGAPAAGLHAEARLEFAPDPEPVPGLKGWHFGVVDETVAQNAMPLELPDADAAGKVTLDVTPKLPDSVASPLIATLVAGLAEPSGRVVETSQQIKLRTKPLLIGLLPEFSGDQVKEDTPARFRVGTFSTDGKPVARPGLHWALVEEERHWDWLRENGSHWTYHYHVVDRTVASGTVDSTADGKTGIERSLPWGTYRLIVSDEASGAVTSMRFSSGWQSSTDMNADSPDKLAVSTDKNTLKAGETARVHIDAPFAGRAEIVIANSRVLETRDIAVPAGGLTVDVKAAEDWGAGAYVLATLYRPLDQKRRAHDPVRAVGLAWIATDTSAHRLTVEMKAPQQTLPRQHIWVPVHVARPDGGTPQSAYVTLAAVDEGILQITKFHAPDPLGVLAAKQRLGVSMRDDYGRLLDDGARVGAVHEGGGGGDDDLGGAALPVRSSRTVALFQGPVALDAKGNATIELDVPDFQGELRLMAVAYDPQALGHADAPLTVRDPVVVTLALPRFLAPGDVAQPVLQLHDVDGAAGRYTVKITTQGPGQVSAQHALDYDLKPGDRVADPLTLTASGDGILTMETEVTGPNGFHVTHHDEIAVREPHFPFSIAQTALQTPGELWSYDPVAQKSFAPGSVSVSIGYNRFGGIDVAGLLRSLYQYPYGCTEQLASAALPLLYFNDPTLIGRDGKENRAVIQRVQGAIDTILDRQDASGRFGLWHLGDNGASNWLNIYAADFLVHARQAGFDIPDAALRRGLANIQAIVSGSGNEESGYYRASRDVTVVYGLYLLARSGGQVDAALLHRISDSLGWAGGDKPEPGSVTFEDGKPAPTIALAQLAGAASLTGDTERAKKLFRLASANLKLSSVPGEWMGGFYYTPLRDLAALIAIAAETRNDALATSLLASVQNQNLQPGSLNTQEKAWLLMAAHELQNGAPIKGGSLLTVNGVSRPGILPIALSPSPEQLASGYAVRNDTQARLFRTVTVTGTPKASPKPIEAGYTLTRTLLNMDGSPVDPQRLRQNDRLIVALSGQVRDDGNHQTVLVDMLPAGWEIEAPMSSVKGYEFLQDLSPLQNWQARDDRFVAAFVLGQEGSRRYEDHDEEHPGLSSREFRVAYIVRLVTPGQFTRPEAIVEDMYRPSVMARTEAGVTRVGAR